jgi:hypothetical protein
MQFSKEKRPCEHTTFRRLGLSEDELDYAMTLMKGNPDGLASFMRATKAGRVEHDQHTLTTVHDIFDLLGKGNRAGASGKLQGLSTNQMRSLLQNSDDSFALESAVQGGAKRMKATPHEQNNGVMVSNDRFIELRSEAIGRLLRTLPPGTDAATKLEYLKKGLPIT